MTMYSMCAEIQQPVHPVQYPELYDDIYGSFCAEWLTRGTWAGPIDSMISSEEGRAWQTLAIRTAAYSLFALWIAFDTRSV
eukprot:Ihof_evm5s164 gene=Ihof_evmTU5s164